MKTLLLLIFVVHISYVRCLEHCPDHNIVNLWSEEYPSKDKDQSIQITKPILLDTTPPDLRNITIENGGKLVWSSEGDYSLRVQYIHIKNGGELHIGGEGECQFDRKAGITLIDGEEENKVPKFGDKFIGVEKGGVLELHGKDKLSWTKLTSTAHKFVPDIYNSMDHDEDTRFGIHIYQIDTTLGVHVNRIFKPLGKRGKEHKASIKALQNFVDNDIADNELYAIATQGNVVKYDMTGLYEMFDDLAGLNNNVFQSFQNGDAYVAIGRKGYTFQDKLVKKSEGTEAKLSVTLSNHDGEVRVISYVDRKPAWFFIASSATLTPIINVVDDVTSWKIGDKIFITSTDYDWKQVEEFTIIDCNSKCSSKQIRLNRELTYTHYGKIHHRVDMRAEVGLMTRHIHIEGEVSPGKTNGGHIKFPKAVISSGILDLKFGCENPIYYLDGLFCGSQQFTCFLKGFKRVRVEGVELSDMGNPEIIGRYPLHYHMCEDLKDRSIYETPSYIRSNSIHHCQFRCVTIHGTHNARLSRNVCFDTVGHGFFLEDGGEKHTHLEGNLGLGNRRFNGIVNVPKTGAIPTDNKFGGPATFWITNPLTTLKNNVAAGGQGMGIWYVYPDEPTGPSKYKNFMQKFEARRTKIILHENNVAHSYDKSGVFVDNIENENLNVGGYNKYSPRKDPLDKNSDSVPAVFVRITAYKNREQNIWIRGSPIIVKKSSFSDSLIGAAVIREGPVWVELSDCVILGYSDNVGNPNGNQERSFPRRPHETIKGYAFRKGPTYVRNTWFGEFDSTDLYKTVAFSQISCDESMNAKNAVENVTFAFKDGPGNRFYYCEPKPGREIGPGIVRDIGNSMSGLLGDDVTVVRNRPFDVTDDCLIRAGWDAALCPHVYGKVTVKYNTKDRYVVHRTDRPFPNLDLPHGGSFLTMLGGSHFYLVDIKGNLNSKSVKFQGQAVSHTDNVVIAMCVPRDSWVTTFKFKMGNEKHRVGELVSSREDVIEDTDGGKYYVDEEVGVVFFKLVNDYEFDADDKYACPKGKCVEASITFSDGQYNENCAAEFFAVEDYTQTSSGNPKTDTRTLKMTRAQPTSSQGAGSTYPFLS